MSFSLFGTSTMRRFALALVLLGAASAQASTAAGDASSDAPTGTLPKCKVYVYYADKRPYESPNSDPFYAAVLWANRPYDRRVRSVHMLVRTQTGLFEKDSASASFEFTLPTHESVVSAWIDRTKDRDGNVTACDPSGAFFVDGLHGVAFTKQYLKHEKVSRTVIEATTQIHIEGIISFRNPGRRPPGEPVPLPQPCTDPDREAAAGQPLVITGAGNGSTAESPSVVADISPTGTVMTVDVDRSAGSRRLDDAMIAAARAASFTPARWKCLAVPDRTIVPVRIVD